jgi:hypothetical protein
MVTGNLARAGQPATALADPATPDGKSSGLTGPSLVKCYNLATVRQHRVPAVIGHLSATDVQRVNACLKPAMDLP